MNKEQVSSKSDSTILWFKDIGLDDFPLVGGKNSSLGELIKLEGVKVPNGFAITTKVFDGFMKPLMPSISEKVDQVRADGFKNVVLLEKMSSEIRALIENHSLERSIEFEIVEAFKHLDPKRNVAVRSSATAEDLPEASFAGQQDTFLNVSSLSDLLNKVKKCFSSLYNARAMSYRHDNGFPEDKISLSVGIQEMVRADWNGVSGVMFTVDTETGNENLILITA